MAPVGPWPLEETKTMKIPFLILLAWLPGGSLDLERGRNEGLWNLDTGRLALTPRGFLRIDTIEEALARHLT